MRALVTSVYRAGLLACALAMPAWAQDNPDYQAFTQKMADKHGFDSAFVKNTLQQAEKSQAILDAIARPWEAKPWFEYYPIFLTENRLRKGVEFWQAHEKALQRAEQETGVPAEIIVAIIGVETYYGTYKGKYPVLDALYTLGFYYPPRSKFFLSELEQYFLLAREEGFDMPTLKGSYAGAMGWGQFISSSYRSYAIDFDADGKRDLLNNPVDAIGSVANYFLKHGWKADEAVAHRAKVSGKHYQQLLSKDLKYRHSWADLQEKGVELQQPQALQADSKVKLLELSQQQSKEHWVSLPNFYVITRYNHSPLYAMAVYQLSQQIKAAKDKL